jgi:DNA repair protein RadD
MFSEWICLEHGGFAGKKARDWWKQRSPENFIVPASVEEAVSLVDHLQTPTHIRVWLNQKHPQIMAYDFSGSAFGTVEKLSEEQPELDVPF